MKLNAYLAGHGTRKTLDKEIDTFGLSADGKKKLREFVGERDVSKDGPSDR
jgi:hypothetical protein